MKRNYKLRFVLDVPGGVPLDELDRVFYALVKAGSARDILARDLAEHPDLYPDDKFGDERLDEAVEILDISPVRGRR